MSNVVTAVHTLNGNYGRKIIYLSNGWYIATTYNSGYIYFYKSIDKGATWSQLCYIYGSTSTYYNDTAAIAGYGTKVYAVFSRKYSTTTSDRKFYSLTFDATTVTNTNKDGSIVQINGQSYNTIHSVSIVTTTSGYLWAVVAGDDGDDDEPQVNSYYSTNNGSNWTEYNISYNLDTNDFRKHASIGMMSNGYPVVTQVHYDDSASTYTVQANYFNGSAWNDVTISSAVTYSAQKTCVLVKKYGRDVGRIWVVWEARDSADSTYMNIHASYSDDNALTWSTVEKVTTGNATASYMTPVLAEMTSGDTYVLYTFNNDLIYQNCINTSGSFNSATITTLVSTQANDPSIMDFPTGAISGYIYEASATISFNYFQFNTSPSPPTLDAKSNFNADENADFSWTFNDPDTGDSQSAFQLLLKDSADATILDTGKTVSTTSIMTLGAFSLTNERTYHWSVRTYDQSSAVSSYPAYDYFYTVTPPVCTITYPTGDNTAIIVGAISATWTFGSTGGNTQSFYQALLTTGADELLWTSGIVSGADNSINIDYNFQNDSTYKIKVTLIDSKSMSSVETIRTFSTNFTVPAQPTLTLTNYTGYVSLAITNPEPLDEMYNEIINGDFSSGTANWSALYSTLTTSSTTANTLVCTGDGSNPNPLAKQTTAISYASGKKLYIRATVRVTNTVCTKISFRFERNPIYVDFDITTPISNQWYTESTILTMPAGGFAGNIDTLIIERYADAATANGKVMQVQQVLVIDITDLNATWQAMSDAEIIAEFDSRVSWFDGTLSAQPTVLGCDVLRKFSSDSTWTCIAESQATSYKDYNVASGKSYWYKVQAIGSNASRTDSLTANTTLTLKGIWLHDVYDAENTIYNFMTYKTRNSKWSTEAELMKFSGRTNPVIEFGEIEEENVSFTLDMTTNSSDVNAIDELIKLKTILCYRDARGRKVFGVATSTNPNDLRYGYTNQINIMKVAYDEEV